jgi:hypothetical protein
MIEDWADDKTINIYPVRSSCDSCIENGDRFKTCLMIQTEIKNFTLCKMCFIKLFVKMKNTTL